MENEIYNQSEVKYFREVYIHLKTIFKNEDSQYISASDVASFFLSTSKLPKEIIDQIGEITGGTFQGYYEEKQLFLALKLIAAAQQRIPITSHTAFLELNLPLPNLYTNNNTQHEIRREHKKDSPSSSPNLIQLSDSDAPIPQRDDNGYQIMVSDDCEEEDTLEGMYSEPTSNIASHSPSAYSPNSDSPTPTNSVHEKNWPKKRNNTKWPNLGNEEHHQLLGTEEDSSDRHSSEEKEEEFMPVNDVSEPDEDDDVWKMTEEQQQYYTHHFTSMQSEVNGFLPGIAAKQFFEKSKLPVGELSKIWQLCDVTRDGALSLEEFFAAMHLVVLRRNKIPLPNRLPPSLMPKSTQWTKFADSPTSTLSSPGPKPVNFDFQNSSVVANPQILHPKPVRVTPEGLRVESAEENEVASEEIFQDRNTLSTKKVSGDSPFAINEMNSEVIADKVPENISLSPSSSMPPLKIPDSNRTFGPTSLPFSILPSPDKPPPPPPRPTKSHTRSSSLDLNKLNNTSSSTYVIHSGSPCMMSQSYYGGSHLNKDKRISKISEDSATILRTDTESSGVSAFEVYKKPNDDKEAVINAKDSSSEDEDTAKTSSNGRIADKKNILANLYTQRERNSVLLRLNSELNQELAEVIEERINLEFQLEQMKHLS